MIVFEYPKLPIKESLWYLMATGITTADCRRVHYCATALATFQFCPEQHIWRRKMNLRIYWNYVKVYYRGSTRCLQDILTLLIFLQFLCDTIENHTVIWSSSHFTYQFSMKRGRTAKYKCREIFEIQRLERWQSTELCKQYTIWE